MFKDQIKTALFIFFAFILFVQISPKAVIAEGEMEGVDEWILPDEIQFQLRPGETIEELNKKIKGEDGEEGVEYELKEHRILQVDICVYCGKADESSKFRKIVVYLGVKSKDGKAESQRSEEGWDEREVTYYVCDDCEGKEFEVNEYFRYECRECGAEISKRLIKKTKRKAAKGDKKRDFTSTAFVICEDCTAKAGGGEEGIGGSGGGGDEPPEEEGKDKQGETKVKVTKTTLYKCSKCGYQYDKKVETLEVTEEEAKNYPQTIIDDSGVCEACD